MGIPTLKDKLTGELVMESKQKAELLSRQYQEQFTQERLDDMPTAQENNVPPMPEIEINATGVTNLLKKLDPHEKQQVQTKSHHGSYVKQQKR